MPEIEHLATPQSYEQLRLQRLRELYPELETEGGRIDPDRLRGLLPDGREDAGPERYQLTWNGKAAAQQSLSLGPTGTLKPCPEQSMDWETTRNVFIEGENLESLRILLKPYFRKVKMIYIDPPYNTGGDFIYKDNYAAPVADYLARTGQTDQAGNLLVSNPETSGRYHSDWLTMMYPRLALARELLREDGVLFCSIDDHEVHNLRLLLNEVFGEENFVAEIVWKNKYGPGAATRAYAGVHEYVLCFSRALLETIEEPLSDEEIAQYSMRDAKYPRRGGFVTQPLATVSKDDRPNLVYPIYWQGNEIWPNKQWVWSRERMEAALQNDEVIVNQTNGEFSVRFKQYLRDEQGRIRLRKPMSVLIGPYTQDGTQDITSLFGGRAFDFPKPAALVGKLLSAVVNGDVGLDYLVMDFFSGSGTTAHAVMDLNNTDGGNRRYIMVQLPEPTGRDDYPTIADIGKERIRRVAARIREERAGQLDLEQRETPLDLGMRVFKLGASSLAAGEAMPDGADYLAAHQGTLDSLLQGWQPEDLLWEVLLREGLPLDCRIETLTAGPQTVYRATDPDSDRQLYVCLDDGVSDEPLAALLGDDASARLVCRESALVDDTVAQNLALHCQLVTL